MPGVGNLRRTNLKRDQLLKNNLVMIDADGVINSNNTTWADNGPARNTITYGGRPIQGTFSPFSQPPGYWSVQFNPTGNADYINSSKSSVALGSGNFTIELWVMVLSTSNIQTFYDERPTGTASNAGKAGIALGSGTVNYYTAGGLVITGTAITPGTWNHIAVSRSGTSTRLFINGIQAGSTYTDTQTYTSSVNRPMLGGDGNVPAAANYQLNGFLSNVRVVVGTALYTTTFTPPTSPLTAIPGTTFLACQSNRFLDICNAVAPTVGGSPIVSPNSPFNTPTAYSESLNGGSTYFNGSTPDYLLVAASNSHSISGTNYTIEYWMYGTNLLPGGGYDTINKNDSGVYGYTFRIDSNQKMGYYNDGGVLITSTTTIANNQWYHIAATDDGTRTRLFINGVLEANGASPASIPNDTGDLYIGVRQFGLGFPYTGYLSNMRIVKEALYTKSFSSPQYPLNANGATSLLVSDTNVGVKDLTGKNNWTSYGNTFISNTQSKFGGTSIFFDGSTGYLRASGSSLTLINSDFTVEAWIYLTAVPASAAIIFATDWTSPGFQFFVGNGSGSAYLQWQIYTVDNNTGLLTDPISLNTWTHVAWVRKNNTFYVFKNGNLVGSPYTPASTPVSTPSNIYIGARGTDGLYFSGYMDNIRVSNYARYPDPSKSFNPSFFIVGGGGGGGSSVVGNHNGGGGGGGGMLEFNDYSGNSTSTALFNSGDIYTVTVGLGGAAAAAGSNSSIINADTSISFTAIGGGAGGSGSTGGNGGSGGGGTGTGAGTLAGGVGVYPSSTYINSVTRQGYNGGIGAGPGQGGGGGGASEQGEAAVGSVSAGRGGVGRSSSLRDGTLQTYAGGGGAGQRPGGSGGGANGSNYLISTTAGSGVVNTGGGGGAGEAVSGYQTGGSGGSGIVVFSYPSPAKFTGGTITQVGGNTVHSFTANGTLTPLYSNYNPPGRFLYK
jgi:hypothetical protein